MIPRTLAPLVHGLLLTLLLASPYLLADEAADKLLALRRASTNVQLNRDGTVRLVRMSKPLTKNAALELLVDYPTIDYLAVVSPDVTSEGLAPIQSLTRLETLLLDADIDSQALEHVQSLPKLERLYLDGARLTDADLDKLAGLKTLRILSLRNTGLHGGGLKHLGALDQLESLSLAGNTLDQADLASLASLQQLKSLDLAQTTIGDQQLSALPPVESLQRLVLTGNAVSDACLSVIEALPALKELHLQKTQVTAEAVAGLRKRRPKLEIYHEPFRGSGNEAIAGAQTSKPVEPASLSPILDGAKQRFAGDKQVAAPDFQRHIIPLFGRLGCNGRSCHGSFQGQGGFRLSMFGYDFDTDHKSLTEGDDPRVNVDAPAESLILNKPTNADDHGGGQRFKPDGWEYRMLRRWIESGASNVSKDSPSFVRLEVTPSEIVFASEPQPVALRAVAVWSDGTREDVTCLTRFQSNDEGVAEVTPAGEVKSSGVGDTHVIAFYDNGIVPVPVIRPVSDQVGERYPKLVAATEVDKHINQKLAKLAMVPSPVCSDEVFLRRVSLDIGGTLPSPDEVRAFLKDTSKDKRARKIDELLERESYVAWWTMKLCDLTGSNAGYLGSTEMAQPVAEQWRAWIERRVRENVPYDKFVAGIVLARSRPLDQTYDDFAGHQSTYTRRKDPGDFAALDNSMPHYWYRDNMRKPEEKALAFGYVFLGVRLQCAQCHKHPYDQWSKEDFERFTAIFERVQAGVPPESRSRHRELQEMLGVPEKLNTAALRRQSYLRIAAEGRPIPWSEIYIDPPKKKDHPGRLLGGRTLNLSDYADPREPLMQWLLEEDNPYFVRALVNRVWAHYLGRGIVEPPDDLNQANPPVNGPLLDYLSQQFIAHKYDLKWLHREITNSDAYQRSWEPNDTNRRDERNFSRSLLRRLPAEVIVDGIIQATANDQRLVALQSNVTNRKITQHPRSYQARTIDYSLLVFGKPLRTTNCDCERKAQPTLLQSLYVRNDAELLELLQRSDGWLVEVARQLGQPLSSDTQRDKQLVAAKSPQKPTDEQQQALIEAAYLRVLGRLPTAEEQQDSAAHLDDAEATVEGLRDLLWVLLNTQEFLTNH